MRFWDRLLLLITSLIVAVVASVIFCVVYFPVLFEVAFLQGIALNIQLKMVIMVILICLFLLALRLLWVSLRRSNRQTAGIDHETEIGQVRISVETIESLAKKAAEKIKGIRELIARVHLHPETRSVHIGFRIVVDGDRPFLELSNELQTVVKQQVESIAGVDVDDVSINITQTVKSDRARIRVS